MRPPVLMVPFVVLFALALSACQDRVAEGDLETSERPGDDDSHVVEFTATNYAFAGPAEVPSGWVTFRMPNESDEHHTLTETHEH